MTDTVYLTYSELIYRFIAHTLRVIQHYLSTICTQVTVHTPSQAVPYTKVLDVALNKIGRAVAGGNPVSIARAVHEHGSIRELLRKKFMNEIDVECSALCKHTLPNTNTPSLFRKINVQEMAAFSWGKCIRELQSTAPVLLQLLLGIVSHSDHRNQEKLGEQHYPGICMAVATLLKERNRQMSGIQTFLFPVLFSSLVEKQVSQCKYLHMCIDVRTCVVVNVNSNFHTM